MSKEQALDLGPVGTMMVDGHLLRYVERGSGWRYKTLFEKEPETIQWISCFAPEELLWDIGANVGIYSLFAAARGVNVCAFEPHFANYFQLCANVYLNSLPGLVMPLCMAFADHSALGEINLASVEFGTSMSSFDSDLDFLGRPFVPAFRQGMIGMSIDEFVERFDANVPDHIKIDVDGLELNIVAGAVKTLRNPKVLSVSVELVASDARQTGGVDTILRDCGFEFVYKKNNAAFTTPDTRDVMNFLYAKPDAALMLRLRPEQRTDSVG